MARRLLFLPVLSSMLSCGSAYYIQSFPRFDIPGRDLVVSSIATDNHPAQQEQMHQFDGSYPQACIDVCVAATSCHAFVTVGDKCWFRGGWFGPRSLDLRRVPARPDYTVYIIYGGLPLFTAEESSYLRFGVISGCLSVLVLLCCCIKVHDAFESCIINAFLQQCQFPNAVGHLLIVLRRLAAAVGHPSQRCPSRRASKFLRANSAKSHSRRASYQLIVSIRYARPTRSPSRTRWCSRL